MPLRLRGVRDTKLEQEDPRSVNVEFDGQMFTYGPNQVQTHGDDGIAAKLVSASASIDKDQGKYGATDAPTEARS